MNNIAELKRRLLAEYPDATEAQINKAIIDYAKLLDFPLLIRNGHDIVDVLSLLSHVMKGDV